MISLTRTISAVDMIAYAGATWDWHRLHYDPAYLTSVGLAEPVVDGQVFGALLAELLVDHLGPAWRLCELDYRFAAMVFAGETVQAQAEITARQPERIEAELRVVVLADDEVTGAEVREAVRSGRAVLVPRSDGTTGTRETP